MKPSSFASLALATVATIAACSSSSTPAPSHDAGHDAVSKKEASTSCGEQPIGSQCKTKTGGCAALQCLSGKWQCASGQTEVAVVPGACGAVDATTTDASCGEEPLGGQCKTATGACAPIQCLSGKWQCAPGQTAVAVVPGACGDAVDSGAHEASMTDASEPKCAAIGGTCGGVGACGAGAGHLGPATSDCSSAENVCCIPESACGGAENVTCCAGTSQDRPICASSTATSFTCLSGESFCDGG